MGTLKQLAADLGRAADEVTKEARQVVSKGALNIKTDARERISGYAHLPHYPRSITYDVDVNASSIVASIGSDREKMQGGLGSYIEYGTVNNGPIPHLNPALDAEAPRFENAAADLGEKLLAER